MIPETKTLLERIDFWNNLSGGYGGDAFLWRQVKERLPELRKLLQTQADEIDALTRDLKFHSAETAEYKTRAESQEKVNKNLVDRLRQSEAELSSLRIRLRETIDALAAL